MKPLRAASLLLVAILFVFAQQGAALHALAHYADGKPAQQEKNAPGAKVCDQCFAYAKVGAGAHSHEFAVSLPACHLPFYLLSGVVLVSSTVVVYFSRAPPSLH